MKALVNLLSAAALTAGLGAAWAEEAGGAEAYWGEALPEQRLAEVRGGFTGAGGLEISFGIERAVYLNGVLVTTTRLNVADLAALSGGRAGVTLSGGMALLQNGPGNLIESGTVSPSSLATVIQNSLDGQQIRGVTTINATANSLDILRSMHLQQSVRGALTDALRR